MWSARAVWINLRGGGNAGGWQLLITQQVARNFLLLDPEQRSGAVTGARTAQKTFWRSGLLPKRPIKMIFWRITDQELFPVI